MHSHDPTINPVGHHLTSTNVDPFNHSEDFAHGLLNAILATALFRCWHLILFFSGWATAICLISDKVHNLSVQTTILTVFGTVLGFVISYRTSSSFERYNEGRRLWSSIVYGSRTLARVIWFHVPDVEVPADKRAEMLARSVIERKSAINLIEAYAVAVKHYLRGEDGIAYEDLYTLVKYLPAYVLPAGRPSISSVSDSLTGDKDEPNSSDTRHSLSQAGLPLPNVSSSRVRKTSSKTEVPDIPELNTISPTPPETQSRSKGNSLRIDAAKAERAVDQGMLSPPLRTSRSGRTHLGPGTLLPARNPPKYALFDVFPFSLFVHFLLKRGKDVKGKKVARLRARTGALNQNIPLEITFYLSSYISELQRRKILDVPTLTNLMGSLNILVESLTGLERILTTPIPFSYSIHLWVVTTIFVFMLPFQLWASFKYLTIPATAIATFVFFGFLVAGEEIENPFGYDKNDLNLDHFTHNIIRMELNAITSRPAPSIGDWIFSVENTEIFSGTGSSERGVTPKEWIQRGEDAMRKALSRMTGNPSASK
ncbi:hypothetical protein FRB99_008941 [Tulasnella sp. 403]|nr:hypothetical protein FRB99_008941 [Tulasnella sp. 403]